MYVGLMMSRNRKDVKEILNKSIDFIKDISVKVQQEASKTWKLSNIRIEIMGLKRKKNDKLKKLGEKTFAYMKKTKLSPRSLNKLYREVTEIEEQLREKEKESKQVERETSGTKFSEKQKRMEISKEKKVKGHSKLSSKSFASRKQANRKTNGKRRRQE